MDPLATPPAVAAFLAVIHDCGVDAETKTALWHSVQAWSPSYHYLRTALGGHRLPFLEIQGYSAIFAHVALDLAQAILDGVANTFRCFFHLPWTHFEACHTHLLATFPSLCAAYHLTGGTDSLSAHMRALHTRLRAYQRVHRFIPGAAAASPQIVVTIVTDLDQYVILMLTFFERNIEHSILCTHTRSMAAPDHLPCSPGVPNGIMHSACVHGLMCPLLCPVRHQKPTL